jgi:hypothetical protein
MDILENQTRTDVLKFKKELQKIIKHTNKNKTKDEQITQLDKHDIKYSNTFVIEKSKMYMGLEYESLSKILKDYGLKQSTDPNGNHLFGIINYKFYQTNFFLLNGFQFIDTIENKYKLYLNINMYFPHYYNTHYPKSFLLNATTQWNNIKTQNPVYIARPIGSYQGLDIIRVYDQQTLQQAKRLLYNDKYTDGVSLTEYITNPMLYEGRKMHLRAYMLFTLINNKFNSYLFDIMRIYTAKHKYKNEDWNNNDIHDTHFKNSGFVTVFSPEIFNNLSPSLNNAKYNIILENIKENINFISKIAVSNIYQYSGSKNAYEVFGIDVLIKDDLSVFIMEINGKFTGYVGADCLFKDYFKWITETVIKPCLFPNLKIEQRPETTPIYSAEILNY